ncbi:hypothetical protein K9N68_11265 [Kovacikia minuta CCNUW1]|uniref:hypothetical protein n=1 Tax=Kovacikia minuta TaxID=2931930 RepID=UPI001CC9715A|nr:hypothetical protein [Kovacikia minuta]UBF28397.1 hypothetical protein K9N68_11265 [Kovacikia minuta CCNUW1]
MQTLEKNALFTELTTEESAEVNGGCYYYYQRPVSYNPCWRPCYNPCWNSSYGDSGSYGGSYGRSYGGGVNQTTNVNVLVED